MGSAVKNSSQSMSLQQQKYFAWQLTRKIADGSLESFAPTLVDSQVDLNPHQVDAALFACRNPLSRGVILADEVGLGKTIEAGLVIAQSWAERRRRILIIVPANLRKQWHQELQDKFGLESLIFESKNYNAQKKQGIKHPFIHVGAHGSDQLIICSYQFAKSKADELKSIAWDLVVMDEAHRLRNVYKTNNIMARTLKDALDHVPNKILLTATPLQNSLLELYGLVSILDDRVFGDLESFRNQFTQGGKDQQFAKLKQRLEPLCKRTLRKQVQPFVSYTARHALVEDFNPSTEERKFSELVGDYLRRPNLQALPEGQRQLISLVLWKLLASSTQAIAGALNTMAERLQKILDEEVTDDIIEKLDQDFETLSETMDESADDESGETEVLSPSKRSAIQAEIEELREFCALAQNIRNQSKGKALLKALEKAFSKMDEFGAAQKAIIFTESRRTQDYLRELLKDTNYGKGLVLFNGTNSDPEAQKIYKAWIAKHQGTDRISGSKTADTRAALVEYFRDEGRVMIATEAGAEGINLQFCSLVINYDLPWNPQRIEQRIGRCHRYGQKHDVVVVNFVDRTNAADSRVYDLLAEKFKLFDGVFGASDEVLGAIGSGVDFERRIAEIYQKCRDPESIAKSFAALQQELSNEINEALLQTRDLLFNYFDENVLHRIKSEANELRDSHEQALLKLTKATFDQSSDIDVEFDATGFILKNDVNHLPIHLPAGRYAIPRVSENAHVYRMGHPFAQWMLDRAKTIDSPPAHLTFDYDAYGVQISTLKPLRGETGQLVAKLLTVTALDRVEEHIIVSSVTTSGIVLPDIDPEKLLKLPATAKPIADHPVIADALLSDLAERHNKLLAGINIRNLSFFDQEVVKLDGWADDLKSGLELDIKGIDREIKETRRTATTATTLEEKLHWQKRQRELETTRTKMRRDLFNRQDEIEEDRNKLIEDLEGRLEQKIEEKFLFIINWELV